MYCRSTLWCLGLLLLQSFAVESLKAQNPKALLPDDPRLESLRSPEQFFGFAIGSRHLRHDQVVSYLTYLAEASERVTLIPYGQTHGLRPLMVAAITSEDNSKNLNSIRQGRPRLTSGKSHRSLENELIVMWMGYSVHGDEASAVNAAPLIAYHLASSESSDLAAWRSQSVVLLDAALNPDGVDRFANWANENRGKFPSPASIDREHIQPWPGGRTNYYYFDLNRDWLPLVHPESQGRLRLFHQWKPNVVLDFHEMSGNATYFFQPGVPARNNPLSPVRNLELTRKFAAEHSASMDAAGELFFTEEKFDDFYVGKGSTYPDLHGAIGILFEQGSTRGLKLTNERTDRSFADTVANQVRTSLSSLRAAAANRDALLEFQRDFYVDALSQGERDNTRAYMLTGTPSRIAAATSLLQQHAIRVHQPQGNIQFQGQNFDPAEVLIIPCQQPEYTFVRSLMEPLQNFRENIFYDVSAWHLPSAFDLECRRLDSNLPDGWLGKPLQGREVPRTESKRSSTEDTSNATLAGYAFAPTELGAPQLAVALQQAGAQLRITTEPTQIDGVNLPLGTFLVLRQPNHRQWPKITSLLKNLAPRNQILVHPLASSMTPVGPDLGSDTVLELPLCKPLLVMGSGTSSSSAGGIWHFMDTRLKLPSTRVDTDNMGQVNLMEYSCLVLPAGSYTTWSSKEVEQIQNYLKQGGTVVAMTSAISWLDRQKLIKLEEEKDVTEKKPADVAQSEPRSSKSESSPRFGDAADARALESVAGAFFNTTLDRTHPLAYGFPRETVPVFRDHAVRFPCPKNPYKSAAKLDQVIAGYVSQANRQQLHNSASAWVEPSGKGRIVLLAEDPIFRGYVRSSERFLTNALLLGPAIKVPSPLSASPATDGDHDHE